MTKALGGTEPRTEVRGLVATYHVWFSPRGRRPALQGEIAAEARDALRGIARRRLIGLLECETGPDHVHLLVQVPHHLALSQVMQFLKGASARSIFLRFPELKLDLGHDHLWQRGYGLRRVDPAAVKSVRAYIKRHRTHDDIEPRTSVRGDESKASGGAAP